MADTVGMADLRAERVNRIVKGFAMQKYKLKNLCTIEKSSAAIESYYKETKAQLTGGVGDSVKGVPRLASFPYGEVSETKVSSYPVKHGMTGIVSWEDELTNNLPMVDRTLLRIAEAVAYSVDTDINTGISAASGINTFVLTAGSEWSSATIANRDPIGDILKAIRYLEVDNYDPRGMGFQIVISPTQYEYLLNNAKVINNPTFKSADVVTNGVVGQICGGQIIVSNAVTADQCYIIIGKLALTWQEVAPLQTEIIKDPMIKTTIRSAEYGCLQVPHVEAICKITNVEA